MLFADSNPAPEPSFGELKTLLSRTQAPPWSGIDAAATAEDLRRALTWSPSDMGQVARGFMHLALRLSESFTPGSAGRDEALLAAAPWLRQTGLALQGFPELEGKELGGQQLLDLVEQSLVCGTLATHAGHAKDAAMDVRVLLGGFAWHLLSPVLTALRRRVAALTQDGKDGEAEALLRPFAPLLMLLGRSEESRATSKDDARAEVQAATAEVQAATEERDAAAARLRLRGAEPKAAGTLADLARKAEPPPPPPGRRSRRR